MRTLSEASLSVTELRKHGGVRYDAFLKKVMTAEPFVTVHGGEVVIKRSKAVVDALKARDADALVSALQGAKCVIDGKESVGVVLSLLQKTAEFGGKASTADRPAGMNETAFADAINSVTKRDGPITVVLGRVKIVGVTAARSTGTESVSGQTSKADVVLDIDDGTTFGISIKMKSADYYLSGDRVLAPIVGPKLVMLLKRAAPRLRVVKLKGDAYRIVIGAGRDTAFVDAKFDIDIDTANLAVFGTEDNAVNMIVKGDLTVEPLRKGRQLVWAGVSVYQSLSDLPDDEKPIGLLRYNAGRGVTWNGVKYEGIRSAVATAKRARNAVDITAR